MSEYIGHLPWWFWYIGCFLVTALIISDHNAKRDVPVNFDTIVAFLVLSILWPMTAIFYFFILISLLISKIWDGIVTMFPGLRQGPN